MSPIVSPLALVRAVALAAIIGAAAIAVAPNPVTAHTDPNTSVSNRGGRQSAAPSRETGARSGSSPGYEGSGKDSRGRKAAARRAEDIPLSVIGVDRRIRELSTMRFPNRAVGWIRYQVGNRRFTCTGFLVNKNTVVTSGICVHGGGEDGEWSTNVRFYPGAAGPGSFPYGSCGARTLYSVAGWVDDGDVTYDYGAIKLNCNIGRTVGWLGYWWQEASLRGLRATVRGYPVEDKPGGSQWYATDSVRVSGGRRVWYNADTSDGQAGSPVYNRNGSEFCRGFCAFAIHDLAAGHQGHKGNSGVRITEPVSDNIDFWRKQ